MYTIGMDIGTSITKVILCNKDLKIIDKLMIKEKNIKTVLDIFIEKKRIKLKEIKFIGITGVGSLTFNESIYNITIKKKDEFIAIADGVKFTTKNDNILIANVGTGTSFIRKNKKEIKHLGGTGIGGGTLEKLCNIFANTNSFEKIKILAEKGNLNNVDLKIKDITTQKISNLNQDTTVSNFGKASDKVRTEDLILSTINMIIETIGVMSSFIIMSENIKETIVTGTITTLPQTKTILKKIEELHNIKFIIPENSEYIACLGTLMD